MTIVLDVSAAMQMLLQKERACRLSGIYERSSWVIAPDLYIPELTNTLWKYRKANIFSHEECQRLVEDGISLIDDFFDSNDFWKEVLGESIKSGHSAYDLFYAVLARRNDGKLLTDDGELKKVCAKLKIDCID